MRRDNIDKVAFSLWSMLHGVMTLILRRRVLLHTSVADKDLAYQTIDYILEQTIIGDDEIRTDT